MFTFVFFPGGTQKSVFTVIPKNNINLKSRSITETTDNHRTDFSLMQMHSGEPEGPVFGYI